MTAIVPAAERVWLRTVFSGMYQATSFCDVSGISVKVRQLQQASTLLGIKLVVMYSCSLRICGSVSSPFDIIVRANLTLEDTKNCSETQC